MIRPLWIPLLLAACVTAAAADQHEPPSSLGRAIASLEAELESETRDAGLWTDYGNLLVVAERLSDAKDAYQVALDLAPDSALAHYDLGLLWLETGHPRRGAHHLRQALRIDPEMARAEYALGAALAARDRHRRAVRHYARAFRLDPKLVEARHNPAILFNELATWAAMHVYLEGSTGRHTRLYENPAPIVGLLIPALSEVGESPPDPVGEGGSLDETGNEETVDETDDDGR